LLSFYFSDAFLLRNTEFGGKNGAIWLFLSPILSIFELFPSFFFKKMQFLCQITEYLSLLLPYLHLSISLSFNNLQRIGAEVQIFH